MVRTISITKTEIITAGLLLLESVLGISSVALGDPGASPNQFYPRNYVNEGLPRDTPRPTVLPSQPTLSAAAPVVSGEASPGASAQGGTADSGRMPVVMIVYVNSLDRDHFNRAVRALLKMRHSTKAMVGAILHIGDYRNVTTEQKSSLQSAGIPLQPLDRVPDHLEALKSPVWEVITDAQPVYFSGVFDIGRFFAADGSLKKEPEQGKSSVSIQEMDGF
jgi:hypothetical protein